MTWSDCAGLSPELRSWHLQFANLSIDSDGRLWRFFHRYHDWIFAGHLGVSRTVCRLLARVHWPGRREDVRSYFASCSACLARKSLYPRWAPMGHVLVGHRWDRVAMAILDMSVTTEKGNRYVLVIVDCPLPNKTAVAVADPFFSSNYLSFRYVRRSFIQIKAASLKIILRRSCVSCWGRIRPVQLHIIPLVMG